MQMTTLVESEYRSVFLKLFPRYAGRARREATVAGDNLRGTAVVVENAPGCVPRFVEKERRPPLRHQGIRSGGNLRVFENLAQKELGEGLEFGVSLSRPKWQRSSW